MKCGSELWQFEDGTELSSRFIECPATGSSPDKPAFQPVFMTFPVSGVHPLTGGNGRTARIMMNAELAAEGEERIIVPTVFRGRLPSALKALSHKGQPGTACPRAGLAAEIDSSRRLAVDRGNRPRTRGMQRVPRFRCRRG